MRLYAYHPITEFAKMSAYAIIALRPAAIGSINLDESQGDIVHFSRKLYDAKSWLEYRASCFRDLGYIPTWSTIRSRQPETCIFDRHVATGIAHREVVRYVVRKVATDTASGRLRSLQADRRVLKELGHAEDFASVAFVKHIPR